MFQLINDKGNIITQLDDWTRPKKKRAMEVRADCHGVCPFLDGPPVE